MPMAAEHLGVKLLDERVGENVPTALTVCPRGACGDVGLFGLV